MDEPRTMAEYFRRKIVAVARETSDRQAAELLAEIDAWLAAATELSRTNCKTMDSLRGDLDYLEQFARVMHDEAQSAWDANEERTKTYFAERKAAGKWVPPDSKVNKE